MIESKKIENTAKPAYPYLAIASETLSGEVIVLVTGKAGVRIGEALKGVVVSTNSHAYFVGYYSEEWDAEKFKFYDGQIVLSNSKG